MITLKGYTGNLEGLSTDQKPADVPVNTEFRELDTNCRFYFTGESWEEIPSSGGGGGSGTSNYNELENKPQIAGVTLSGNKTLANLGIQEELSFDNAPTEDSTNPVTSGGVYEALEAKQDTLTIDDTPTEDSTNPVTSGGVYEALENKQDNLVFDGTYDSSTNKVATESTVFDAVSTAVGNLTNDNVGLGNVTNNTQIKALSGSVTSGGIVTFGADGATVSDSGKTIETNLSNSNDNVPTSKAVRDKVAGSATMASNYSTDSSESSITSASTINDAIEQLDYRTTTNKNNILSTYNQNGKTFNLFDINRPIDVTYHASGSVSNDAITVTPLGDWAYVGIKALNVPSGTYRFSGKITNLVTSGSGSTRIVISQYSSASQGSLAYLNITQNGDFAGYFNWTGGDIYVLFYANNTSTSSVNYTYTASEMQIIDNAIYSAGFTDYQPYALPNTTLTPALIDCVENGKSNYINMPDKTMSASGYVYDWLNFDVPQGDYVISLKSNTAGVAAAIELADTNTSSATQKGYRVLNPLVVGVNHAEMSVADGAHYVRMYANGAVTLSDIMLIPLQLYKAGVTTYQPYAMSNVELTNELTPTAYNTLNIAPDSAGKLTIQNGGYVIIGKLVIISARLNITGTITNGQILFKDLPSPLNNGTITGGSSVSFVANSSNINIGLTADGRIANLSGSDVPTGTITINSTYIMA